MFFLSGFCCVAVAQRWGSMDWIAKARSFRTFHEYIYQLGSSTLFTRYFLYPKIKVKWRAFFRRFQVLLISGLRHKLMANESFTAKIFHSRGHNILLLNGFHVNPQPMYWIVHLKWIVRKSVRLLVCGRDTSWLVFPWSLESWITNIVGNHQLRRNLH